jgi:hypothetical protein
MVNLEEMTEAYFKLLSPVLHSHIAVIPRNISFKEKWIQF